MKKNTMLGLGGEQSCGNQMFSWIHVIDFCSCVNFILKNENIGGVINIATPNPVTNTYLMKRLRKNTFHKIGLPAPKWLLKLGAFFIGTETELILKSRYIYPEKLKNAGFNWGFSTINQTINNLK